jgi:hypothetical protein
MQAEVHTWASERAVLSEGYVVHVEPECVS